VHEVVEPAIELAEQVGGGHPHIIEVQFSGVLTVPAHLVQLAAALKSRHASLHHQ
jgi:hypothetical protein